MAAFNQRACRWDKARGIRRPDATAQRGVSARLPFDVRLAAAARATSLMCIGARQDRLDSKRTARCSDWFDPDWLMNYVGQAIPAIPAKKPRRVAIWLLPKWSFEEVDGQPRLLPSKFFLRPLFPLRRPAVFVRLVSRLHPLAQGRLIGHRHSLSITNPLRLTTPSGSAPLLHHPSTGDVPWLSICISNSARATS